MDQAPKESTTRQLAKATATGAVGAIPGVGSPIAAILGVVLGYGYGQRLEQWRDSVTEAIMELQDKVDQSKADDPEFLDTVVAATRAVAATSRQRSWTPSETRSSTLCCQVLPKTTFACATSGSSTR